MGRRLTALAVLVLVGVLALIDGGPPSPRPDTAPASEFSAERATRAVGELATEPRPIGGPASDRTRDELVRRLDDAGLDTRLHVSAGAYTRNGATAAGAVENVVATLPGTAPTGAVLMMAHYDSVARGPGAADDMASVASILEAVRAVRSGPPLRNDVVVLITDGEEAGLLGAQAWVRDELSRDRRPTVALNFEAAGTAGPSQLFQTSPGNADLVAAWSDAVPHATGDSAQPELYKLTTADTDLSTVLGADRPGLNFAFTERPIDYHTAGDAASNLSAASVQGHGDAALGLTRELGRRDLAPFDPSAAGNRTFFRFLGTVVSYPQALVWPFAALAALAVLGAVALGRARGLLGVRGTLGGAGAALLAAALGVAVTVLGWEAVLALRPSYADAGPDRLLPFRLAAGAIAVAVTATWLLALRRRPGSYSGPAGAALVFAVLGIVTAATLPGASFLFALPALGAGLGLGGAVALRDRPWLATAAATLGAVPAVALLVPFGTTFSSATISDGVAVAVYVLAGTVACAALACGPPTRTAWAVPAVALVVAVALIGAGVVVDRPSAERPQGSMLAHLQDADSGVARWVSSDVAPAEWTLRYLTSPPTTLPAWIGDEPVRSGPAPRLDVPAPQVIVVERSAQRTVLQVASPRGAPSITLRADRQLASVTAAYPGRPVATSDAAGGSRVVLSAVPAEGVRVTLVPAAPGPVGLTVSDVSDGLGSVPGFAPRPPELRGSADSRSDQVVVSRRVS